MKKKLSDIGKYTRHKRIGYGNFSDVYEAYDRALEVKRALKIIKVKDPKKLIQKFHEARLQEICKHKHVVEVKDADICRINGKSAVFIATEIFEKGSAQKLIESRFVSLYESINIVCGALFGLEHLHNNGVIHCDIKPDNILLTKRMIPKLSDFGLAVRFQLGEVPPYVYTLHMAPESTTGTQGNILTDVYAMGVTFYRLVNNIANLKAIAPSNVRQLICKGKFPDRNGYSSYIPAKIKRIANKALNPETTRRYQNAADFRQALEKIKIDIDWKRMNSKEWMGKQGKNQIRLVTTTNRSGWYIEFLQNGRRKKSMCRSGFKTNWEAENYISKLVAETSIF